MGKWGSVYNFKQLGQDRPHEQVTFERRLEGEGKLTILKAKEQPTSKSLRQACAWLVREIAREPV